MNRLKLGGEDLLRLFGPNRSDPESGPGSDSGSDSGGAPESFVERRAEPREAVFQEVVVTLEDYHKLRAIIVNLSSRGARIQFSNRTELPFRVRLSTPTLKLNCWARVVWQADEAAGLEFLPEASEPPRS